MSNVPEVSVRASRALAVLLVAALGACSPSEAPKPSETRTADKAFVSAGRIEMQLDAGDFTVRAAADNHVRVTLTGSLGDATADITVDGTQATVAVKKTPHNNFHGAIEIPQIADLVIHLTAGNLVMDAFTGNKNIDSMAGNTEIAIGDPNDYSSVDATLKAGDIDAAVFGGSKTGLFPHFTWSGPGKYSLRANLGAGNLTLKK